ncbi:protein kinase domain protein [Ichthyophthirius multifiliis]|uniref:non-specific serine/threonine protein kinase n=1 Tax=Ichthyophthirius multifiliis TaxID=5932 RepID=G0QJA9_ICHMU|nr:protein kinase domain protein [Ichthyophthirius multifiliis]EGR34699.1 protein kinase domain protein [Ichthyophthirius multifiliis]|eukprot:XP_004040003.1 protein kinase domain protein [Ichthyophthirius multifiliis]
MGCGSSHNLDQVKLVKKKAQLTNFLQDSKRNIRQVYKFISVLGKGGFGTVKLAQMRNNSKQKIAIKIIQRSRLRSNEISFLRELEILRSLDHPYIIKFHEVYVDEMFFYICMEYCEGGELLERITQKKFFKESEVAQIMEKLLYAVNYMHNRGILHRDLKLQNILFASKSDNSDIKIIDFGLSSKCDEKDLNIVVGTPLYVSPNIIQGKYDRQCDNWSLGVILYILLVGYPPFNGDNKNEIFQKIQQVDYSLKGQEWDNITETAKDLVKKFLVIDSKKIISIRETLQHPWILQYSRRIQRESTSLIKNGQKKSIGNIYQQIDPKIINMLKNYKPQSKLKTELMKVLVNQLDEKEIESLNNAFSLLDFNYSGIIEISDLQQVMQEAGCKYTKSELQKIIKNISQNSSSNYIIQYSEFIAAALDQIVDLQTEKIQQFFKYFDRNNNNEISVQDLKEVFTRNGRTISDNNIAVMLKEFIPQGNGKITFKIFNKIIIGQNMYYKT